MSGSPEFFTIMSESSTSSVKAVLMASQDPKDADLKGLTKAISHSSENGQDSEPQTQPVAENQPVADSQPVADTQPVALKSFGIRRAELEIAQMTNRWHKLFYFFTLFIGMFILMVDYSASVVFVGYATNSYKQHSLMSTITVIGQVAMGASMPFFARASDVFGRLEIFVVALVFKTMGTIIQSQALDVQRYAAGSVFYAIGNSGLVLVWQVGVADASTLKYRFLALSSLCSTMIITTWSTGEITNAILKRHSWRFGVGLWAYVTPLTCLPYMLTYLHLIWKARRTDLWKQISQEHRESFLQGSATATRIHQERISANSLMSRSWAAVKFFFLRLVKMLQTILWDMDLIGCLLIGAMLGLFLVPLTLAGGANSKWQRASTIVPLVMGFVTIPIFIFWESKLTKRPLLPWVLMRDRGIWAAFGVCVFAYLITSLPGSFAYPVLLVGMNATVKVATRTPTLGSFTEGITVPIVGLMLTKVRRTKPFILLGDFIMLIAMGLFVHFRGSSDGSNGKYFRDGVAAAMCVSGVAQALFYRLTTTNIQACTNHEYLAPVTALFGSFITVGASFGRTISGAIWTQRMYSTIYSEMEKSGVDTSLAMAAYSAPYDFIVEYPWGSDPRVAVSKAYAVVQRQLSIVAICLCFPMLVFIILLRDHRLADTQNLDDLNVADPEKASNIVEREKTQILFKDDKDYILIWFKKLLRFKRKHVPAL